MRNGSYASAWQSWFPLIEGAAGALTRRMIALGAIGEGQQVLDIGTGIGEPAISAARAVGLRGRVLAIDPDPEMIAIALRRATEQRTANVEFRISRAEDLQVAAGSFDAVLCRWSLMFVDDLGATLAGIRRLLKPGGRLVAATWMGPERVPALSLARRAVHLHFGRAVPDSGPNTAFALSDVTALARAVRDAGFGDVRQVPVVLQYEFASVDDYVRFREDLTGSLFASVGEVAEVERTAAMRAVAEALKPFRTADGFIRMPNEACCTVAVRQAS